MSTLLRSGLAGMLLVAMLIGNASAQCNTCAQPTVAYQPVVAQPQPVVAQPTVAYRPYTGWYPGKLLDRWRLRRAGVGTTSAVYTTAYAPTYTAAYAPSYSYTASYAPATYTASYAPTYTAAYRPYVTSFAPLSSAAATGCPTCTQTVARPVLMRPVVASACDTCSYSSPCDCGGCGSCDTCSAGVSQAIYSDVSSGCSSCAAGGTTIDVMPSSSGLQNIGPATTQPELAPIPEGQSQYRGRPIQNGQPADSPVDDVDPLNRVDPINGDDPSPTDTETDSSTWYRNAPQLLGPRNNTALRSYKSRKPTVEVRTAVYRNQGHHQGVSQPKRRALTQAEIDAQGWSSVPRNR